MKKSHLGTYQKYQENFEKSRGGISFENRNWNVAQSRLDIERINFKLEMYFMDLFD